MVLSLGFLVATTAQAQTKQAKPQQCDTGWFRDIKNDVQRTINLLTAADIEIVQLSRLKGQWIKRSWLNKELAAICRKFKRSGGTEAAAIYTRSTTR